VRALLRLGMEAREIRSSCDPTRCRAHLVEGFARILGADAGGVLVDTDFGLGRGGEVIDAHLTGFSIGSRSAQMFAARHGLTQNPGVQALARRAAQLPIGGTCSVLRAGRSDARSWCESPYVAELLRPEGLEDGVFALCVTPRPGVIHGVGYYRAAGSRRFDARDRGIVELFASECSALFCLPDGADAASRLPRRHRAFLEHLLSGASEKEVAATLGLSRHTAHQYVKEIYRAVNVRSRAELMARLLG